MIDLCIHNTLKEYLDGVPSIQQSQIDNLIAYAQNRFTQNKHETLYRFEVLHSNNFKIVSTSRCKTTAKKVGRTRFKEVNWKTHHGYSWKLYQIATMPMLNYENIKEMLLELYNHTKRRSIKTCLSLLEKEQECIILRKHMDTAIIVDAGIL